MIKKEKNHKTDSFVQWTVDPSLYKIIIAWQKAMTKSQISHMSL